MKPNFDTNKEYVYNNRRISNFKGYRPVTERHTYIRNGYAYFAKCIVHYTNYELVVPKV